MSPQGQFVMSPDRAAWRAAAEGGRGVPVAVLKGPRMEAQLLALASNVRRKLGLTKAERTNASWRLVWEHGYSLSKTRLARAADVSDGTVGTMRRRWQAMLKAGEEPSFDWRSDMGDKPAGAPEVDGKRRAAIADATIVLRRLLLRAPPALD